LVQSTTNVTPFFGSIMESEMTDRDLTRAERLEAALKSLVENCEVTRDTAGFWKPRQVHQLSPTQWQSWCKQIKSARAALKPAPVVTAGWPTEEGEGSIIVGNVKGESHD
jgi:hypothetical protein